MTENKKSIFTDLPIKKPECINTSPSRFTDLLIKKPEVINENFITEDQNKVKTPERKEKKKFMIPTNRTKYIEEKKSNLFNIMAKKRKTIDVLQTSVERDWRQIRSLEMKIAITNKDEKSLYPLIHNRWMDKFREMIDIDLDNDDISDIEKNCLHQFKQSLPLNKEMEIRFDVDEDVVIEDVFKINKNNLFIEVSDNDSEEQEIVKNYYKEIEKIDGVTETSRTFLQSHNV